MKMSLTLTVTELRANLYKVVDQVIETGVPVEVLRDGHRVKIILADGPSKFQRLTHRSDVMNDDPESFVHCDWLSEWSETKKKDDR